MTTQSELERWFEEAGIRSIRRGDAFLFDCGDPHGEPMGAQEDMAKLEIRDGAVVLDWNYNGYGEDRFDSIKDLDERWRHVLNYGLEG